MIETEYAVVGSALMLFYVGACTWKIAVDREQFVLELRALLGLKANRDRDPEDLCPYCGHEWDWMAQVRGYDVRLCDCGNSEWRVPEPPTPEEEEAKRLRSEVEDQLCEEGLPPASDLLGD